jgi:hypothetical protein
MSEPMTRREALSLVGALGVSPATLAQAGQTARPSPATSADLPPDLANLHGLMAWLGRVNAPRLSFLESIW